MIKKVANSLKVKLTKKKHMEIKKHIKEILKSVKTVDELKAGLLSSRVTTGRGFGLN
jgi:Asp-tRNA(Asn)/Glu-tRNA(Gln) amidotransferase C subunit